MKTNTLNILILLAIVLAACTPAGTPVSPQISQAPPDNQATVDSAVAATVMAQPPTPSPTVAPAIAPTAFPAAGYTPALTGVVWQWMNSQSSGQVTAVNDPTRYQIQFNVDGMASIKADCNMVTSKYTLGNGNTLAIQPGASTMVACPPDSQADAFLAQLGATAAYQFINGALVLNQADPNLTMTFQMLPVAILPTPEANTPSVTADVGVNVRSGPGTSYTIYGVLQGGKGAQVVGKSQDGGWWALNMPVSPTGTGWVSGDNVTVSNVVDVQILPAPAVPPNVQPVAPGPNDPQATALQPVYVRQGPGETYPAYGVAQPGQTALVIGKSQDGAYWVVRLNPAVVGVGSGWVEASMTGAKNVESVPVITAPVPPAPAVLPPPIQPGLPAATAVTAVNLRTGPSTEYPVLAVAQAGQSGEIIGVSQDGAWWQVRVQEAVSFDRMAWVTGAYVMAVNTAGVLVVSVPPPPTPIPVPTAPAAPSGLWVVTIEPINVRAGPGNEYPSYGKIGSGTPLLVTGQSGSWLSVQVDFLPGGVGWISSTYVVPFTGPQAVLY